MLRILSSTCLSVCLIASVAFADPPDDPGDLTTLDTLHWNTAMSMWNILLPNWEAAGDKAADAQDAYDSLDNAIEAALGDGYDGPLPNMAAFQSGLDLMVEDFLNLFFNASDGDENMEDGNGHPPGSQARQDAYDAARDDYADADGDAEFGANQADNVKAAIQSAETTLAANFAIWEANQ